DLEDEEGARRATAEPAEPPAAPIEPTTYVIERTSMVTAEGEPIVLSLSEHDDGRAFRLVIRPTTLKENKKNPAALMQIRIHHQRRAKKKGPWQNVTSFKATSRKAGEEISFDLHSEETLLLYKHLTNLYEVAKEGIKPGVRQLQVIDKASGVAIFAGQD